MNNASTPDGRRQDGPNDAEPFFPSEGSFNPVVPLSEIDHASPLPPVDAADVGRPAAAEWAREAHRARSKEDEETLVTARASRARRARPSWLVTASVIVLSAAAGLASGTYFLWSSRRAPEAQPTATAAAEAPSLPPAPVEAGQNVERSGEPAGDEKPGEVAQAEKSDEVAHAPKPGPPARTPSAPRAQRPARAAAEPKEVTPAPKPARTQSAPPTRPRLATADRRPPATAERTLPVSSPRPSAKAKKVIQWP